MGRARPLRNPAQKPEATRGTSDYAGFGARFLAGTLTAFRATAFDLAAAVALTFFGAFRLAFGAGAGSGIQSFPSSCTAS